MKLTKYHYHVMMIKDLFQMMEFTRWLILIKIVLQAANKLKKDRDEEDRDDRKILC